jgi:predicted metal-dependent phosphoesterase TrpH
LILELHIHSQFSYDSLLTPEKILEVAKYKGLSGIAITDHETIRGGLLAQRVNRDSGFAVIVGSEVKTDVGDIIGLFLHQEIKSRNYLEVIDEIRDQGGMVVLPHPFRGHKLSSELVSAVDAIETFNSRTGKAENILAEELRERHGKAAVAGSDAHFYSEIGLGRTEVNGSEPEDIRSLMLDGKTVALEGSLSHAYLQSCSQLIKAFKLKKYSAIPRLLASASAGYLLRS